jgi:hypothetical protein
MTMVLCIRRSSRTLAIKMGGFGRRSTALEVVEGVDLTGQTAVVTGGNR